MDFASTDSTSSTSSSRSSGAGNLQGDRHYPLKPNVTLHSEPANDDGDAGGTFATNVVCCEQNMAVVGILVGLIILLSFLFLAMIAPTISRFVRRKVPVSDERIERRYETVEGWLISKVRPITWSKSIVYTVCVRSELVLQELTDSHPHILTLAVRCSQKVHAHDECCERVQKAMHAASPSTIPPIKLALSCDTTETEAVELWEDEEEEPECPICIEPFAVDEIVSYSPNKACSHAFHHECIKEWLLRNGNCPFCREVYLPIDEHKQLLEKEELRKLAKARSERLATSYFCVREGLVSVRRSAVGSDNADILDSIDHLTHACLKKDELVKLRGSRFEGSNDKTVDDDGLTSATQVLESSTTSMEGLSASTFEAVLTSATASSLVISNSSSSSSNGLDSDEEMGIALRAISIFRETPL
jgi:hypothetical protein